MTDYDDEDRYYHQRDKRALWWVIGVGGVMLGFAVGFAVFIGMNNRPAAPERIVSVPSASQTMTVTETPATVTETPPVTLTETRTETSPVTVVVTRTEPVTTTVTTTVTAP